jgi:uncharacterized protein YkwD
MITLLICSAIRFGSIADAHVITPTERELEMLNEVNYVRTRPAEYVKHIVEYTDYWDSDREELACAKELKAELLKMKPLDSLKWSPDLYHDAYTHGTWMKKTGNFEHSDYEWAENIVAGDDTPRMAVLNLVIDSGVSTRGHRKNILNPDHTKFACYEVIGNVGDWPFVYVQEFD